MVLPGSQAKVPHGCARPVPGGLIRMLKSNQRHQLKQQTWLGPQLLRCHTPPSRPLTVSAATAKLVAVPRFYYEGARIEFFAAGIPEEVVTKLMNKYPAYLRWPIETKLRPALQLWLKHLGSRQELSERLDKCPQLLTRTSEECNDVYVWLASLGLDAERIQQKDPRAVARQLSDVQSTVQTIQKVLGLTNEQLPAFFKQHACSLRYSPDRVTQTLQTVAELLAAPVASKEMQEVVLVCDYRLFDKDPAQIYDMVSLFCTQFKGGQHAAKAALKKSVYLMSAHLMTGRAAELKTMLGWTEEECNQALSSHPGILTQKPSTVASNMQKLQAHNFTSAQVLKIYATRPNLAGYDRSSPSNVEKLMYLMLFLQLTTAEIKPQWLPVSLERCIGPRSEFMYRSRAITPDTPVALSGCSSYLNWGTDAKFASRFNSLSASPPLLYDEAFKQHWWQRWKFLRHEMGLSVADISACRALSCTSLPNTLAPRWRFLTQLEAAQANFRAADHLMALATLSDELFAETFDMAVVGLTWKLT